MLMRLTFWRDLQIYFILSTARTPEVSFQPLPGMSSSAWLVLRSWGQISETCCWWWTRCSLSAWSCRRLLQAPLESELLVLCAQWDVDHHNNSVEDVDCGHWDCAHAEQYVVFRLASLADVCEAQSRIHSEWSTGRRGKSMICVRFETPAVDVASSCSRATV